MKVTDQQIIEACQSEPTMSRAAKSLEIPFGQLRRRAIKLNCYSPNMGAKGTNKKGNGNKIPLTEILEGLHPYYQSNKLKLRMFDEGLKDRICENCSLIAWLDIPLAFELHHIDGNRHNHKLDNLRILCPNCHSLTDTYRGRNIR